MFTEVGQIVGTLEYMAPEQAELNNLDIDTRADIYSLGRDPVRTADGQSAVHGSAAASRRRSTKCCG